MIVPAACHYSSWSAKLYFAQVLVSYYLLVVQSARSTHTVWLIVLFQVLFFQSNSNFVKSGSGPEHWSFELDTERVGVRLRPGLKSRKFDCITSTDCYVRSTRLRRRMGRQRRRSVVKASTTKLIGSCS